MSNQLNIKIISKEEDFSHFSKKISIKSNQQYKIETNIIPINGKPYSGYFVVIILDSKGKELNRHIKWINVFDGKQKNLSIIFTNSNEGITATVGFKINIQTPVRSDVEIQIPGSY